MKTQVISFIMINRDDTMLVDTNEGQVNLSISDFTDWMEDGDAFQESGNADGMDYFLECSEADQNGYIEDFIDNLKWIISNYAH